MCCKPDERKAFTPCSSAQSIAFEVGQELQKKNSLRVPLPLERGLVEQLLLTADQLLRLVAHLASFALATVCTTRCVVDTTFQDYLPPIQFSVLVPLRHLCMPLVHAPNNHLSTFLRSSWDQLQKPFQGLGLRTLLQKSRVVDDDPCPCLRQIFGLMFISFLLSPRPQWMLSTISVILDDLENFLYISDVDQRCPLVDQLIALDSGALNFGEWFVQQELKHMSDLSKVCLGRSDGARPFHGPTE